MFTGIPEFMHIFITRIATLGITLFVLSSSALNAQESSGNAGTASALLLRFNPSVRVAGMSGAYSGLADDENALLFNPAGLTNMNFSGVSLNHTEWLEDIRIENLTAGYAITRDFGVGIGLTHMWMGDLQGTDEFGNETESFSVSSSVLQIGGGYKILSGVRGGVAFKYVIDDLAGYKANGFAFDAGFLFNTVVNNLTAGLSVQNLGGKISYDQEKQSLPLSFRGGLAYDITSINMLLTADAAKSTDTDLDILLGVEYTLQEQFTLRAGNRFNASEVFTPSFGAGFCLENSYHFQYTFVTLSELGATHRIGFTYTFKAPGNRVVAPGRISSGSIPLYAPSNVQAVIDGNDIVVTWNPLPGVTYNVYARHSKSDQWAKLTKTPLIKNELRFPKPSIAGEMRFKVTSLQHDRESDFSKEVSLNVE